MSNNRLEDFTLEEIQTMYNGSCGGFRGTTTLPLQDADTMIRNFNTEIEIEIKKRHKVIEAEIERTTPRCECCNQRIEK